MLTILFLALAALGGYKIGFRTSRRYHWHAYAVEIDRRLTAMAAAEQAEQDA